MHRAKDVLHNSRARASRKVNDFLYFTYSVWEAETANPVAAATSIPHFSSKPSPIPPLFINSTYKYFISFHHAIPSLLFDVPIGLYGFQHYLSMLGSIILIPLVIVPTMGGTYEDTANVVSTVLFVSGVTIRIHVIQGPSFVYLAPALVIINSPEFQGLNGNKLVTIAFWLKHSFHYLVHQVDLLHLSWIAFSEEVVTFADPQMEEPLAEENQATKPLPL
ncbi:hypothetical protein DVH24_021735 [Malus domestica]|uniref:Uncharacterized protein n=1 Tax=Malus domestica TaxID=3750 RepID=A0A498HY87_MALDO|nr:hypothetical protein DVH24_021735 [Malus domestica]